MYNIKIIRSYLNLKSEKVIIALTVKNKGIIAFIGKD
jgi:hypothetical protein